jgi:hypothetical protein
MAKMRHIRLTAAILIGLAQTTQAQMEMDSPLPDFNPERMVRFESVSQAERRRESLQKYIWPEGLPSTRPKVSNVMQPSELEKVSADLIDHVDRFEITVGPFDFEAIAFRVVPRAMRQPAIRVMVHHGHVPDGADHYLDAGVKETIEFLLQHGCEVTVMQMPLVGWNGDSTGIFPDQTPFELSQRGTAGHQEMFTQLEPHLEGQTFRFFLEPILQVVNELTAVSDAEERLVMIGLSGGGWATHMAAAIDVRIDDSVPVAGAMPLYARAYSPGSKGDTEQYHEPLYREVDRDGDGIPETAAGVASWLEIFALGAMSQKQPRRQIQVLNFYDSCCFSGDIYRTYDTFLEDRIQQLGTGSWSLFVDRTHRDHLISVETLEKVVKPLISAASTSEDR